MFEQVPNLAEGYHQSCMSYAMQTINGVFNLVKRTEEENDWQAVISRSNQEQSVEPLKKRRNGNLCRSDGPALASTPPPRRCRCCQADPTHVAAVDNRRDCNQNSLGWRVAGGSPLLLGATRGARGSGLGARAGTLIGPLRGSVDTRGAAVAAVGVSWLPLRAAVQLIRQLTNPQGLTGLRSPRPGRTAGSNTE